MFLKTFLKKSNKSLESAVPEAELPSASPRSKGRIRTGSKLLAVEPRVMFDGAAVATAEASLDFVDLGSRPAAADVSVRAEANRLTELGSKAIEAPAAPVETGPKQLLVIDTGVADWQSLISNLPSEVNVLVLDATQNALTQIADRAQALGEISALHIISHGESASLSLAGMNVDAAELTRSQAALQAIGQSMTENGDILLYGCDVGAGSAGAAFIAELAQYTQADVAASTDLTGSADLGGDWVLEASAGTIEAGVVLSAKVMDSYRHVLIPGFEPILSVQKGVVTDDVSSGSPARTFTVDDSATIVAESTLVSAAGVTGNPLSGVINTGNFQQLDTDESNLDGADSVRYAVVVTNTAPGDFMAFDVKLRDALPTGVVLADVSNFRVTLGDGTVVYDGTALTQANLIRASDGATLADAAATMAAFFDPAHGVEFIDPTAFQGILRGANNPDTSPNTSGTNVLIVTYDVNIDATNAAVSQAGRSLTSSATLFGYTDSDAALNLIDGAPVSEEATINIVGASITKVVTGTSEPHTTVTDVAIGEEVTYQVTITIPEGTHLPVVFHDCLDDEQGASGSGIFLAGMSHLGIDSITFSSGLSSDKGTDLSSLQASGAITMGPVNGFDDRALTIDFNQLTNSNTDNSTPETITIVYRALVLNRPQNQEGTLLLNFADIKVDGVQQDVATDGVRVREPVWAITVTPDNTTLLPGDTVNFTVCVTGSNLDGFNGTLDSMLPNMPAGLTYVPGSFAVDVGASTGLGIVADPLTMSATIVRLSPGQQACFTFQATVDGGVTPGQTLNVPALVRYSSLPNDPDNTGTLSPTLTETTVDGLQQDSERTGAQGVSGNLNDYAASSLGAVIVDSPQVVLTIVQTSEANTSPASGNPLDPGLAENIPVAVGEVVRYRALVRLPESTALDAGIQVSLPDGMRFLNDGAVTYALVSDGGLSSSTLAGSTADGGTPANAQDIASIRPTAILPGAAIVRVGGGAVFASGDDVRFLLGNLVNGDSDGDTEWVVVEFNAVVADQISNQDALTNHRGSAGQATASALSTQFDFVTQATGVPLVQDTSDIDTVTVREPAIVDLSKTIVSRAGDSLTYTVVFSNTGTEEAYNVNLRDDFNTTLNFLAGSLSVTGVTTTAAYADNSTGNMLDLVLTRLNPGESVSVTFTVTTAHEQAMPAQLAVVTYEGLSTAGRTLVVSEGGVPVAGIPMSTPGDARIGSSFVTDATTVDNYVDQVLVGAGVISGRLWDDTNVPGASAADSLWGAGDKPLSGITVNLVWVGPGPAPAGLPTTTVTDVNGHYAFVGLPAGSYQVVVPAGAGIVTVDGPLNERFERDGSLNLSIDVALAEGTQSDFNDFAYVQINDAPTVTVPTNSVTLTENITLCFDGGSGTLAGVMHLGTISVGDPEAADPATQSVTLVATNGVLDVGTSGAVNNGILGGVTVSGDRTTSLSLTGTRADINTLLQTLCYQPTTNFVGAAQISIVMNDAGNGGDLNAPAGNGTPFETLADNLTGSALISLTINQSNLDVTLTIVQTSEANTSPASGNSADPALAENIPVAIGEVVRYRALVRVPESTALDAGIRVALPDGMRFLNDGAVTYALVSDGGLSSSTLAGAVADGGSPANPGDIASIRPTTLLSGAAITRVGGGAVFATGDDVLFHLGNLVNADSDADGEWVVIEFNAVVENQLGNQDALSNHTGAAAVGTATALSTQFDFVTDVSGANLVAGTSDIDTVNVREPSIIDMSKVVVSGTSTTVTFEITFSNSGNEEAYNVHLLEDLSTASNIAAGSLTSVNITSGAAVTNNSTGSLLDLSISRLNPGESLTVTYTATVADPSQGVPPHQAQVTYEGLSAAGHTLTPSESGVPLAGVPATTASVIRIGTSYVADGIAADNYVDQAAAGSGVITGRIWNDTNTPSGTPADGLWNAGDKAISGVVVRLLWVGPGPSPTLPADVLTDVNGMYSFTGLQAGNYQVVVVNASITTADGPLEQRFEADGSINRDIAVGLSDGSQSNFNDFAYVEINDAPTVTVPTPSVTMNEDETLCFDGGSGTVAGVMHLGSISVGDPEAYDPATQTLTLVATNGILDIGTAGAANNGILAGVTVSGDLSATLSLTGTRADINALLPSLCYKPLANFYGAAQIQLTMNDRGNGGDLSGGNGIPFEAVADNLTAIETITINVVNVPDATEARPDEQTIAEPNPLAITALTGNAVRSGPGANAPGDVLDFDADGDVLTVVGVAGTNAADVANTPLSSGVGSTIAGIYGNLVMNADGTYTYTPNANAQTIPQGATVQDIFSYTISDLGTSNNLDTTTLTINITGANDGPVANPDTNVIHGWSTTPTTGNAVTGGSVGDQADTDIDAADVLGVIGVQAGLLPGAATGNVGAPLTGAHGTLTLNSDGSYSYLVNPADPVVIALNGSGTTTDTFTYTVSDGKGGTATTTLVITIDGRNEPPAGTDKSFTIPEDSAPIPLTPADFGFSDPDTGDGFKAVRIDTLPVPASGVLTLNGVPVTVGQIIPFANISQLAFAPAANANSTTLGGDPGFNFSVCDINGPEFDPVPNRISFHISPVNDPPTAPHEVFTVPREATLNTSTSKLTAVVGPTDPDLPADTLQIQILSLPPASQGSFYRPGAAGPVPVVVGDLLTPAELQQMCFVPASTISGTPNPDGTIPAGTLGYKVTDVTGATANGSISINVPRNLPPVAPDQVFVVPPSGQTTLNNLTGLTDTTAGVKLPSDPDQPVSTLDLTITTLPNPATEGVFYKPQANGTLVPLQVGDVLTAAQLQQLQFVPAAGLTGTPDAQGLIPAGKMTYLASDGRGGVDPGSIAINVRPPAVVPPPPTVPVPIPVPPGSPIPVPHPSPTPIARNVETALYDRLADEVRLSNLPDRSHFDPFNPLAVKNTEMVMDRVEKGEVGKAKAEKPTTEEDDCEPSRPKVKIKPKAVKRAIVEDKLGPKVKNFSEMLNSEKKRFKPPVKLKPKPAAEKVC